MKGRRKPWVHEIAYEVRPDGDVGEESALFPDLLAALTFALRATGPVAIVRVIHARSRIGGRVSSTERKTIWRTGSPGSAAPSAHG